MYFWSVSVESSLSCFLFPHYKVLFSTLHPLRDLPGLCMLYSKASSICSSLRYQDWMKSFPFLKFSGNSLNYGFKSYTSERCNCYFVHVRHPARFKSRNDFYRREMDDCWTDMRRFITSEGFDVNRRGS